MYSVENKICNICLKQSEVLKCGFYDEEILSQIPLLKNVKLHSLCVWCDSTLGKVTKFLKLVLESQRILNNADHLENTHVPKLSIHKNESTNTPSFSEVFVEDVDNNVFYSENADNEIETDLNVNKDRKIKQPNLKRMQFSIQRLSIERQLEEIEMRKRSLKYKQMEYQCGECGVGFVTGEVFEEHMKRHSEPYASNKCVVCKIRFKSKQSLSQHRLLHSRVFLCNICGKKISKWSQAVAHRYKCGNTGVAVCVHCSKVYGNSHSLEVHIRGVHTNKKRYVCEECERCFGTRQRLRVHRRTHTGAKPYVCECGKRFSTKTNLKTHQSAHSDSREHYCVECNTKYKTLRGLQRHLGHTLRHGDRKFQCSQCDKTFPSANTLSAHSRVHFTQYTCGECSKNFSSNSNLRKHIRCVHKTDI